jgi:hypothetical protein
MLKISKPRPLVSMVPCLGSPVAHLVEPLHQSCRGLPVAPTNRSRLFDQQSMDYHDEEVTLQFLPRQLPVYHSMWDLLDSSSTPVPPPHPPCLEDRKNRWTRPLHSTVHSLLRLGMILWNSTPCRLLRLPLKRVRYHSQSSSLPLDPYPVIHYETACLHNDQVYYDNTLPLTLGITEEVARFSFKCQDPHLRLN